MDQTAYQAYRFGDQDPPEAAILAYGRRMGHAPTVVVAHPTQRELLAAKLGVPVETMRHGGPFKGELWLS